MRSTRIRPMVLVLILVLIISACTPATPASPTAPPTAASTATTPATAVPTTAPTTVATAAPPPASPTTAPTAATTLAPTAAPTAAQGKPEKFHGVTFTYDVSVGTDVTAELVPTSTEPMPAFAIAPEHVAFTFVGYPYAYYGPEINVFSLAAYLATPDLPPVMTSQADELRTLLAQRPDLNQKYALFLGANQGGQTGGFPPLIPPVNAQLGVAAKKGYVNFANGSGIRFVYWASQALMYVDPNFMFYTYEGLTSDGKHVVVATFPVHAPISTAIPTPSVNTTVQEIDTLNQTLATQVDTADPAAFTPPLPMLDALIQSIKVEPGAP